MKFEVRIPIEGYCVYIVEADSEQEAREIAYDGDADLTDSYWEHTDLTDSYWEHADNDYKAVEITLLEDE